MFDLSVRRAQKHRKERLTDEQHQPAIAITQTRRPIHPPFTLNYTYPYRTLTDTLRHQTATLAPFPTLRLQPNGFSTSSGLFAMHVASHVSHTDRLQQAPNQPRPYPGNYLPNGSAPGAPSGPAPGAVPLLPNQGRVLQQGSVRVLCIADVRGEKMSLYQHLHHD